MLEELTIMLLTSLRALKSILNIISKCKVVSYKLVIIKLS
jgi:hypothetical protein